MKRCSQLKSRGTHIDLQSWSSQYKFLIFGNNNYPYVQKYFLKGVMIGSLGAKPISSVRFDHCCDDAPQHFLNFLPLPQRQGSLRPTFIFV